MKAIIAAAVAAFAIASIGTAADAHPHHMHKVCARHHHHLVCSWVR